MNMIIVVVNDITTREICYATAMRIIVVVNDRTTREICACYATAMNMITAARTYLFQPGNGVA